MGSEMCIRDRLKEGTPDVSGNVFAKWGVVPNDVSLPTFALRVCVGMFEENVRRCL